MHIFRSFPQKKPNLVFSETVPPKKTLFPGNLPLSEHFSLIPCGINKNRRPIYTPVICNALRENRSFYYRALHATLYGKIVHFTMERCVQRFTYRNRPYSVLCTSLARFSQKKPSPVFSDIVPPKKTLFPGNLSLSEHFRLIPYGINKNRRLIYTPVICNAVRENRSFYYEALRATLYEKIGDFTMERCMQRFSNASLIEIGLIPFYAHL
jgi:hypothetical protein